LNTTIVVRVGEPAEQRDFTVLHSIATKSSKFMQTTFDGDWRESHEKRVSLPEIKVCDFEVYLEWLYTGHVVNLDDYMSLGPALIRLYVLGDFLSDDQFSNAVMDALIRESQRWTPRLAFATVDVDFAWDKTMPGSGLRNVLVDLIIRDLSGDPSSHPFRGRGTWCHEVTAEVLTRMSVTKQLAVGMFAALKSEASVRRVARSAVEHPKDNKNKCADYHKHGEGHPKCTADQ
jgi:hypothetical protein